MQRGHAVGSRAGLDRVGGWATVGGVLGVAACVAVPVGPALSAVLTRWLPAAHTPGAAAAVAGLLWLLLAVWLLDGVRARTAAPPSAPAQHRPAVGVVPAQPVLH
jgi:hypothetical protein